MTTVPAFSDALSSQDKRERWFKIVEEQAGSGLSQVKYCQQNGIKISLFAYYRKQYAKSQSKLNSTLSFQALRIEPQPNLELHFNAGCVLKLPVDYPVQQIAHLIKQL